MPTFPLSAPDSIAPTEAAAENICTLACRELRHPGHPDATKWRDRAVELARALLLTNQLEVLEHVAERLEADAFDRTELYAQLAATSGELQGDNGPIRHLFLGVPVLFAHTHAPSLTLTPAVIQDIEAAILEQMPGCTTAVCHSSIQLDVDLGYADALTAATLLAKRQLDLPPAKLPTSNTGEEVLLGLLLISVQWPANQTLVLEERQPFMSWMHKNNQRGSLTRWHQRVATALASSTKDKHADNILVGKAVPFYAAMEDGLLLHRDISLAFGIGSKLSASTNVLRANGLLDVQAGLESVDLLATISTPHQQVAEVRWPVLPQEGLGLAFRRLRASLEDLGLTDLSMTEDLHRALLAEQPDGAVLAAPPGGYHQ